jgi:hypothetical protein
MTAQPRKLRDREPGPADSLRRTSGPPPSDGNIAAGTASRVGRHSHGGCLTYSVPWAARLTSLYRDLLYDQMRLNNLARVKVGTWRLITCQHLQYFLGTAS